MSTQTQPQAQAYPLQWPSGFPRWKNGRGSGSFKTNFETALRNVKKSLELFAKDSGKKIVDPVLSSNIDFNPLTHNSGTRPVDPGVAVWFAWDGLQVCIPVDRYDTPAANLQAIHHIIEARRVVLRHGTLALVRATFSGFQALPAPKGKHWRDILEIGSNNSVTKGAIEGNYKRLAQAYHPDREGGSIEKMAELNAARDAALSEIG
ncbi:J domain-containing protein [Bradyrhizobium guangdongense]|uniref:J domain-containing protein n=1 Tax=Bradyrhizobium guangdongense TaxID=1325090 RepID=UPI00131A1329|nr:J domain-containing protein [Bradyrhizobium guangdongense]